MYTKFIKKIESPFKIILNFYILSVSIFTIYRILLFVIEFDYVYTIPKGERIITILQSFLMGLRFDIVISGYIIILPAILILLFYQFKSLNKYLIGFLKVFLSLFFSIAFLISGADLAFFHHYFARFNIAAFQWVDSPEFMFGMIFKEFEFWWVIIPIIISIFFYIRLLNKWVFKPIKSSDRIYFNPIMRITSIALSLAFIFLMLIGIRGRIETKSPIRVGTAYFSNYAFANMLGLNPSFTLIRSYLDEKKGRYRQIELMDNDDAISNTQEFLSRKGNEFSPIAEEITPEQINSNPPNVILVIMESMSAAKMSRFGNKDNLTPFLDSIANLGYSFDNIYSAGIHTYNGVYSTLVSFPALFIKHTMHGVDIPKYYGIASNLKANGYSTIYFTTHDDQFDNVGGFLHSNDFEKVISQQDYPMNAVKSHLGVPDDYMFEFSMPILNKLSEKKKPFFATFMTASDHGPYIIPEYFTTRNKDIKKQATEYADWSLEQLVNHAKEHSWFDNTIFVFVADHGYLLDTKYDIPISYNHIPFVIHSPKLIKEPKAFEGLGGQVDVFPTLMGLLSLPYKNYSLGVDLQKHDRPYMYFCNDNKLAVIDIDYLYIYRQGNKSSLYNLHDEDVIDYIDSKPEIAEKMKNYGFSQTQAAQYLINKRLLNGE